MTRCDIRTKIRGAIWAHSEMEPLVDALTKIVEQERDEAHDAATSLAAQVNDLRAQLATLQEWAIEARAVIDLGVELMPIDQLREWAGVRAVQETYPDNLPDAVQYVRGLEDVLQRIASMFKEERWFSMRESKRILWRAEMVQAIEQVLTAKENRG